MSDFSPERDFTACCREQPAPAWVHLENCASVTSCSMWLSVTSSSTSLASLSSLFFSFSSSSSPVVRAYVGTRKTRPLQIGTAFNRVISTLGLSSLCCLIIFCCCLLSSHLTDWSVAIKAFAGTPWRANIWTLCFWNRCKSGCWAGLWKPLIHAEETKPRWH